MDEKELNKRVNEVFDLDEGEQCYKVSIEDGKVLVYLVDNDGVVWNYVPDMSERPEALAYLLGKRNDFND